MPLIVRLALHTGEAELRDGDYFGSAVNRCARLRAVAHGGQTLLSRATYDLVRGTLGPDLDARDLGEHRLKDLSVPERIYQLVAPGLPSISPPLLSLNFRPNNLPVQLTSFVGREHEVTAVTRLIAGESSNQSSGVRLLTLTGPGGTGKTALPCMSPPAWWSVSPMESGSLNWQDCLIHPWCPRPSPPRWEC
ncbi:MAG: hypothetical protein EXS36_11165 [Pedosphaera sp.]|nr:hypothetical protein [Pedosphaera sp.]